MQRVAIDSTTSFLPRFLLGGALALGLAVGQATMLAAQDADGVDILEVTLPDPAPAEDALRISLRAVQESGPMGEVVIERGESSSELVLQLRGAEAGAALVAVLTAGGCGEAGEVLANLGAVEADADGSGQLAASLPVAFEQLPATAFAVRIAAAGDESGAVLSCGENGAAQS
jgi:hypothetical protein